MISDTRCLILFVKYPDRGKVKSRLAKEIDENTILKLYKCFVLDLLGMLDTGGYRPKIFFSPPSAHEKISLWLGNRYAYALQDGSDLGEKMKNAFTKAFSDGCEKVVLIGSDIPDLTKDVIDEAFASDADAVIGPALDGGYYLIGFRRAAFLPSIFEEMPWSTGTVFARTIEILKEHSSRVHILPPLRDVDTPEDLKAFYEANKNTVFAQSRTMKFIEGHRARLFHTSQPPFLQR